MTERQFDASGAAGDGGVPVDYSVLCDELRCHPTESVAAIREEAVREQRWWRMRELAATRVLDERGQVDDTLAGVDGVSIRDVRATVATARALEDLPSIAAVAAEGRLSDAQLAQVVKVADATDEAEWAQRAPRWSPADLAQKARELRTPTIADAAARRAARELRTWWDSDQGMLRLRGALPDVDGATFELVVKQIVEGMRPAAGQPWEPYERRGADALMMLVESYRERRTDQTTTVPGAHLVVQVPVSGPATVAGIPLPDEMVEKLRASARIEPHLVDPDGDLLAIGRTESVVSPKMKRAVLLRDGKCRIDGCDVRGPLDVHHLIPKSWGGTDTIDNLAAVCKGGGAHHGLLIPHGPYILLGNPNRPDGLTLLPVTDLPALAQLATQRARADQARAGPDAAA
ncbi:MAG: DUF222 domain-containing protein [Actinobacteria bacterium]|nr:DUF222 domain-containing protein [Actinomycetota bacterium]